MRFLTFVRSVYRNRRRRDDLPRFLTHTVTFACNARCIMCDSWKKTGHDDLTIDEIRQVYRQLPAMDGVRLTGGEPFVRKDMLEIADAARLELRPLFLHITSNGFLTDRIVEFCERRSRALPLHLLVSIDGVEDKHDTVRGSKIAWRSAMNTLTALAPRRKELNLRLAVNQTIVDAEGAAHYPRLREVLAPMGIQHNMVMAYDASATYSLEQETDLAPKEIGQFTTFGNFGPDELRRHFAEVEKDLARMPLLERIAKRYYTDGIRQRLLGETPGRGRGRGLANPPCVALNAHLRIFPNGDVPTCQFNSKIVGNLRRQSFAEVWNSDMAKRQRGWVRACPGCWAECEVLPSAIYTGDILRAVSLRNRRA